MEFTNPNLAQFNFDDLSPQDHPNLTDSGPQQTRKPTAPSNDASLPQRSTFDPKALLNPKAASNGTANTGDGQTEAAAETDANGGERSYGIGQMIENLHGVTDREDAPLRKRKAEAVEIGDSEDEKNKQKSAFTRPNGGSIISSAMKEQRANMAPPPQSTQPIDLTNDDDDVQFVKASPATRDMNEDVCLGLLHASANAFRLPTFSVGNQRNVGKDHWPRMKLKYKKAAADPKNMMIDLLDKDGDKFATLEPKLASGLAPMLAGAHVNGIRVSIYLVERKKKDGEYMGMRTSQSLKLDVLIYAPRSKAESIARFLSQKQLFFDVPHFNPGKEYYNPNQPQVFGRPQPTQSRAVQLPTVTRTQEEMRRETDALFDKLSNVDDLPKMEPTDLITSELLDHQKQALYFLTQHERDDFEGDELPEHSLWELKPKHNGQPSWYHKITYEESAQKPDFIQGGILADVMGLGKTLSILSLLAHTRDDASRYRQADPEPSADVMRNARGTLIICPKSVMSNWAEQIEKHTADGKLRVYQYHGANRMQDFEKLARFDVVLTTYNTAASEFSDSARKKRALNSLSWFRIVLDEAHTIRNTDSKMFKACSALDAERRWAVTGTPVQNSLHDLGALLKFLRLHPFDNHAKWNQYIMSPFKIGDVEVVQKLQILVRTITLCRGKSTIGLPDREETCVKLKFSTAEAALYRQFAATGRTQFTNISQGGKALKGKAYAHVLKSIGRLRALCAHGREMITDEDLKDVEGDDPDNAIILDLGDEPELDAEDEFVTEKQAYETFTVMQDSDVNTCEACQRKVNADKTQPNGVVDTTRQEDSDSETSSSEEEQEEDGKDDRDKPAPPRGDLIAHLTPCYHLICPDCTEKHVKEAGERMTADRHHDCPYCGQYMRFGLYPIRLSVLRRWFRAREDAKKAKGAKWDETTYSGPHTKVKALLEDLRESARETSHLPLGEPPIRSVVFSGWTGYLDLIEYALTKEDFDFTRIDGAMSVKQRSQAIQCFNTLPKVTVLLVSIKAGGQGLNFTAANKAYVMEPQFNPGVEQQAVDRVHRIGQNRAVKIKHFIMEDSIEEAILNLQRKKEKLAQLSMDKKRSKAEENKARMAELQALFK